MKANDGKIAVTAHDAKTLEGYQIKGTTEYITEGAIVDTFKNCNSLCICSNFSYTKTEAPSALWECFEKANRLFIWYFARLDMYWT